MNKGRVPLKYSVRKSCTILRVIVSWSILVLIGDLCFDFSPGYFDLNLAFSFIKLVIKSLVQKGTLWHFWYFGALIIIYFCLPLMSKAQKLLPWIWIACLVASCLIQISSYIVGTPLQSYCIQTFRFWTWFQYFILGGLLGRLNQKRLETFDMKRHTICLIVVTIFVAAYENILGRYVLHDLHAEYFYDSIFTVLWLVILFTWVMRQVLSLKFGEIIGHLSPLTMGIYIIHPLIIKVASYFLVVDSILLSVFYFVAILIMSTITVWIISKIPLINKLVEL